VCRGNSACVYKQSEVDFLSNETDIKDIRLMKPLSLFIITLLLAAGGHAYGQAVKGDSSRNFDNLSFIAFNGRTAKLDREAKNSLNYIVQQLRMHHNYEAHVSLCDSGTCAHPTNLGWHRTVAVCNYLVSKKVAEDRVIFSLEADMTDIKMVRVRLLPGAEKRLNKTSSQNTVLKDSDGDGIIDQFDFEPNTPANAEVDTHGRAIDTDGDSVPDYLDKEKLTPNNCFPVNKDGIGTCPEPDCCRYRPSHPRLLSWTETCAGAIDSLSVVFKNNSSFLNNTAKNLLDSIAGLLVKNQSCLIYVRGFLADASYRDMQLSWDRVYNVIEYLKWWGIPRDRMIFSYENVGLGQKVVITSTSDAGPYIVPAPHPFYSTIKNLPLQQVIKDLQEQH